jgi:RNA polymerase sigma-70 factor, ECF subfamily
MHERDHGELDTLLAGTSLDTPAARRLRQHTSPAHAELARTLGTSLGAAADGTPARLHVAPSVRRPPNELDAAFDAARHGVESAFATLWTELNPLILRYLRVVVGDAAEDVAAETWLQALREIRAFRGDATGFRIWLFRVARNRALEELRRAGGRREHPVGLDAANDRVAWNDPADEAVERFSTRNVLSMIAALPPDQAEAVMLRVVAGMDLAQTASLLGKRPGAVRVATMRGLRRLGQSLERVADTEDDGLEHAVTELGHLRA